MKKIIFILMISLFLLFGCTSSTNNSDSNKIANTQENNTELTQNPPEIQLNTSCDATTIQTFDYAEEGDLLRFYFMLQNQQGTPTTCDGLITLKINDDLENELYSKEISIKKSDFVDYEIKLTGKSIGKAYEWRLNKTDIKKSYNIYGTAILKFKSANLEFNSNTNIFDLISYTDEELAKISEDKYLESATDNTKTISEGNFKVTISKSGFFEKISFGEIKNYYRIDMEIENIGDESDYFSPSGLALIIDKKQYDSEYNSTIETYKNMYPGIVQEGYLLFDEVPTNFTNGKLTFEMTSFKGMSYEKNKFEYPINNN
jgi:hypothetical protein